MTRPDAAVEPAGERERKLHERLSAIWGTPPGLGALTAVNHSAVGRRFIVAGFVFFLIGGMLAMMMRVQLAVPGNDALGHQAYREFFTMHGTTMMFLFAVPILEGFAAYLIPKMIGARDLVFPRLGAFGYYCYLFGGILLYSSFLFGAAPDGGWFMYVPLIMASILLEIERAFGFVFYDATRGGHPLLWQHLFWFFGHPEVYIVFLPAAGMVSTIIPVSAGTRLVGYRSVVLAVVATGFISFGLWVHHMFTVGIPYLSLSFFSAASMAVVIPTGIQIFAWIATLWKGRPIVTTPMLYVLGFFFIFVIGGLTGVMLAFVPFNWQAHDTHFVVAHLHYVLIGGMLFPLFAGLYHWLPLLTGRVHSPWLGRLAFWLIFFGFNVTFLPMHYTGLLGMPRRVYTYAPGLGWETLNLVSTAGAFVLTVGIGAILVDLALHVVHGRRAARDPWRAGTLEWALALPVSPYNVASIPPVHDRDPLWTQPALMREMDAGAYYLGDPRSGARETLGTSTVSAEMLEVIRLPKSTWIPLLTATAVATFFVSMLAKLYWVALLGIMLTTAAAFVWAWTTGDRHAPDTIDAGCGVRLPTHYANARGPGWWGTLITVMADAALYTALLFAYFFLWTVAPPWPPAAEAPSSYGLATIALLALLASSGAVHAAARMNARGRIGGCRVALVAAVGLAAAWTILQIVAFPAGAPQGRPYASVVYTIVAFNVVHVAIAALMGIYLWLRLKAGYVNAVRVLEPQVVELFWHYTVAQWLAGYAVVYLFPLLT